MNKYIRIMLASVMSASLLCNTVVNALAEKDPTWGNDINYRAGITYPIAPPNNVSDITMDKYNKKGSEWITVGMNNDEQRALGVTIGSDGAQRPNDIGISSDGKLVFVGHDISTLHRSKDGGKTWERASSGLYGRSVSGVEVDPNNKNRVLAFATNEYPYASNGLFLSTDMGDNWTQVLSQQYGGSNLEWRTSLVWDPSSYRSSIGGSGVAYWSKNYLLKPSYKVQTESEVVRDVTLTNEKEGLWKTTNGGTTWKLVNSKMSDSCLAVHPTKGIVYAGNLNGFYRSEDGGVSFTQIIKGKMIYGLDVISTQPDYVYINDADGVLVSKDCGLTFERISSASFPASVSTTDPFKSVCNLKVSPQNPNNMVVTYYSGFGAYDSRIYYSNDGGKTWGLSNEDSSGLFFRSNDRESMLAWDPTDANKVFGYFGDYVSVSTDGGKTFKFSADGMCDVFVDGRTIFNIYDPDIFFYGSQDFCGAITYDNGENWKMTYEMYNQNEKPWSGFLYGTYATTDGHMFAGVIRSGGWGNPIKLMVSHDWGKTWTDTEIVPYSQGDKKNEFIYQSPTNENVIFVGGASCGYRTTDKGYTWEKMSVNTVMCHNPYGKKEIYATKGTDIYVSYNSGDSWELFLKPSYFGTADDIAANRGSAIWDMAYDGVNNILYYVGGVGATGRHFVKVQNGIETDLTPQVKEAMLPAHNDVTRGPSFQLCTVDPRYPQVIYVGGYSNVLQNPAGVVRSVDGGESFQILSNTDRNTSIVKTGQTGGIEPYDLIVHPVTGELWVSQGCAGWAKIAPPYETEEICEDGKIPNFVYYAESFVQIRGKLDSSYAGKTVTMLLLDENGQLAHVAQEKIDDEGKYLHEFAIDEAPDGYTLRTNVDGKPINDSVVSAIAKPERITVDLEFIDKDGATQLDASIFDTYGIYQGGQTCSIILAAYNNDDEMLGIVDVETITAGTYKNNEKTLGGTVPDGTTQLKAIVLGGFESMEPIRVPLTHTPVAVE